MFRIQEMKTSDFNFAVELANSVNWNMSTEDFAFNQALEPNGCFTLFEGPKRLGIATCINYGKMGWFGNLIVREKYRRKGAGKALVQHALDYLQSTGVKTVGLYAYEYLKDFYGKLGFRFESSFAVLRAQRLKFVGKPSLVKANKSYIPEIVSQDATCFGDFRNKLLQKILQDGRNHCYTSLKDNAVGAFAVAKVYNGLAEIGPLVCSRENVSTAVALLRSLFSEINGLEVWMCAQASENSISDEVAKVGFAEEFRVARMFLGSVVAGDCLYIAESLERG